MSQPQPIDPEPYPNDTGRIWMIEYETAEFWETQVEIFATEAEAIAWKRKPPPGCFYLGDIWEL